MAAVQCAFKQYIHYSALHVRPTSKCTFIVLLIMTGSLPIWVAFPAVWVHIVWIDYIMWITLCFKFVIMCYFVKIVKYDRLARSKGVIKL